MRITKKGRAERRAVATVKAKLAERDQRIAGLTATAAADVKAAEERASMHFDSATELKADAIASAAREEFFRKQYYSLRAYHKGDQ